MSSDERGRRAEREGSEERAIREAIRRGELIGPVDWLESASPIEISPRETKKIAFGRFEIGQYQVQVQIAPVLPGWFFYIEWWDLGRKPPFVAQRYNFHVKKLTSPPWADPQLQNFLRRGVQANPRGDEAIRRAERGEGGDPKIEAWRRGLVVPPDGSSPGTSRAYWSLSDPRFDPSYAERCYVEASNWLSENTAEWHWLVPNREYSIKAIDDNAGWFSEVRIITPRDRSWDSPEVQEAVAAAYQRLVDFVRERLSEAPPVAENSDEELRRLRREVESKPWWRVSQAEKEALRRARIRSGDLVCVACGRQLGRPQDERDRREDARGLVCWRCFHGFAPNPDERMRRAERSAGTSRSAEDVARAALERWRRGFTHDPVLVHRRLIGQDVCLWAYVLDGRKDPGHVYAYIVTGVGRDRKRKPIVEIYEHSRAPGYGLQLDLSKNPLAAPFTDRYLLTLKSRQYGTEHFVVGPDCMPLSPESAFFDRARVVRGVGPVEEGVGDELTERFESDLLDLLDVQHALGWPVKIGKLTGPENYDDERVSP